MIPTVFRFCLSGWPPPGANAFEWDGSRLTFHYWRSPNALLEDQFIVPTPEQWQSLWGLCDRIGLWSWPDRQGSLSIIDGLQYALEFAVEGRSVTSRGQASGDPELRKAVLTIHEALQRFIPTGELDQECLRVAERKRAEYALQAELNRLAEEEHNRRCSLLWERVRKGAARCPVCGNSVFRLSTGMGLNTCVICRTCGKSFVDDESL